MKDSLPPARHQLERLNKDFIVTGIKDGAAIAASPLRWQKKDWIKFSALAGSAGGLMLLDKEIKSVLQHNQNNFTTSMARGVEPVGNIYGLFVFPAIYVTGLAIKNPHVESIGLRGSKAMAISSIICFAGKNLIRRQRPDASTTPFNYAPPFSKVKYNSFPSAHSSIAFTLATALAMEFPDKKWVAPVAYSIASLTALSRVYDNRHWASDIIVGAALGHFVTKAVYNRGQKKHRPAKTFM
ncbi:phosphatase PAP2 family protein [Niabella yanshanensis]|uniref:Phosphatase PAP2 family protein n=1 Tax=Niabella yanshanensis TaxID=577386 RepID=A0ABZ0W8X8_9BACT|nr:phosphatase PAP2 family protein [Niabella yanshanensis]WQD39723.1 phosphatase PAP2 family protein [Niabella yanshanensis]